LSYSPAGWPQNYCIALLDMLMTATQRMTDSLLAHCSDS